MRNKPGKDDKEDWLSGQFSTLTKLVLDAMDGLRIVLSTIYLHGSIEILDCVSPLDLCHITLSSAKHTLNEDNLCHI
jgi:hypothetical protein